MRLRPARVRVPRRRLPAHRPSLQPPQARRARKRERHIRALSVSSSSAGAGLSCPHAALRTNRSRSPV
jgi:hypothetical protein